MKKMYPYFSFHKIKFVNVILKNRVNASVYYLVKELRYYGLSIISFRERKGVAHNGTRPRKLRRT